MKLKLEFKADVYNGITRQVANFTGTLVSIAKLPIKNVNNTEYYPATVDMKDSNGNVRKGTSCMIYKTSFDKGMEIGQDYLGSVTIESGKQPLIKLTSGTGNGTRATMDDFDFQVAPAPQPVAQPVAQTVAPQGNLSDIG
jgi:hypothetical protein